LGKKQNNINAYSKYERQNSEKLQVFVHV